MFFILVCSPWLLDHHDVYLVYAHLAALAFNVHLFLFHFPLFLIALIIGLPFGLHFITRKSGAMVSCTCAIFFAVSIRVTNIAAPLDLVL